MKRNSLVFLIGAVVSIAACSLPAESKGDTSLVACTEEFRISTVTVFDEAHALVGNASVLVTVPRTRDTLTIQSLALWATGVYPIVDDGAKGKLLPNGDTVHVAVTSPKGNASVNYVFDVPNGCHINKLSGPDTLILQ